MKKLLSIFSSFGIIMSSSLSIIACKKEDKQALIDKAIEQLKDQTINISVTNANEESVKSAIKENSDFKAKLADTDSQIKIESFAFKKDNASFQGTFVNNEKYEVTVDLKIEDSNNEKIAEGKAIFKIKIIFSTQQQVNPTIPTTQQQVNPTIPTTQQQVNPTISTLFQTIDEEVIVLESTDLTVATLKNAIKNLQKYKDIVKDDVTLQGDLTLKKADEDVTNVEDGDVITVTGRIKQQTVEKSFTFTVKIDVITNQEKIDKAHAILESIKEKIINLVTADLTVIKLKEAIKNLQEYKDAFKNGVTLKNDLILKKDNTVINSIVDNDVISVTGTIQVGTNDSQKKERNFRFTVKVEATTSEHKINAAVTTLQSINQEQINLVTADLSVVKLSEAIKNLQKYKDTLKNGVSLKGHLILKKANAVVTSIADNDVITVSGKLKLADQEKEFTFTVKVKELNTNQQKVDNAVAQLQKLVNKEISLVTAGLTATKLSDKIKALPEYKSIIKNGVTLKGEFTFEKPAGTALNLASVANNDIITVKGTVQAESTEKQFSFTVKINDLTDRKKVSEAISIINTINNREIQIATADLSNPVQIIKDLIKNSEVLVNALTNGVILVNDELTLKKSGADFSSVEEDDEITVTGKFKAGSVEQEFTITVIIDELTNQKKVSETVEKLQEIDGEIISLNASDLNVGKVKEAIKNLEKYQFAFKDGVTLKKDLLTLKKFGTTVNSIADGDIITVEGSVVVAPGIIFGYDKEEKFVFTVMINKL